MENKDHTDRCIEMKILLMVLVLKWLLGIFSIFHLRFDQVALKGRVTFWCSCTPQCKKRYKNRMQKEIDLMNR